MNLYGFLLSQSFLAYNFERTCFRAKQRKINREREMAYRRVRLVAPLVVTMMLIAIAVYADQIIASEGGQSENNNT